MKDKVFALNDDPLQASQLSGQGKKHVLVIIRTTEAEEKTLYDLLGAIKLDASSDIVLLKIASDAAPPLHTIVDKYQIKQVLAFGFTSEQLGLHINHAYYHAYHIGNKTYILSELIEDLNQDKNKKIALWKTLQETFLK